MTLRWAREWTSHVLFAHGRSACVFSLLEGWELSLECFTAGQACLTTTQVIYQPLKVPEGYGERGWVRGRLQRPGWGCHPSLPLGGLGAPLGPEAGSGDWPGEGVSRQPWDGILGPAPCVRCRTPGAGHTWLRPSEGLSAPRVFQSIPNKSFCACILCR